MSSVPTSARLSGTIKESKEGRMVDALAHSGDEGRDKLRKAAVRRKWPLTRGYPNGTTQVFGLAGLMAGANEGN